MYHGFNCMLIFAALDGRTWINTAKPTHENQINDVEDPCRDSNHFKPYYIVCLRTFALVSSVAGYCTCSCILMLSSNESYLRLLLVAI